MRWGGFGMREGWIGGWGKAGTRGSEKGGVLLREEERLCPKGGVRLREEELRPKGGVRLCE